VFFFFTNLQTQRKIYFKTFVFHIIYINFKNPKVMKKVKFANLKFESVEILTKKQQGKVLGGYPQGCQTICTTGGCDKYQTDPELRARCNRTCNYCQ
jgi:hypothetical protein